MPLREKTARCSGTTAKGSRCSRNTIKYPGRCFQHFQKQHGLRLGSSTIPGAGVGLFALKSFKKNAFVADYTGRTSSRPPADDEYSVYMSRTKTMTARTTQDAIGSRANDCRSSNKAAGDCTGNNAKLSINNRTATVTLRATRPIKRGDEVLVPYGAAYWRKK